MSIFRAPRPEGPPPMSRSLPPEYEVKFVEGIGTVCGIRKVYEAPISRARRYSPLLIKCYVTDRNDVVQLAACGPPTKSRVTGPMLLRTPRDSDSTILVDEVLHKKWVTRATESKPPIDYTQAKAKAKA